MFKYSVKIREFLFYEIIIINLFSINTRFQVNRGKNIYLVNNYTKLHALIPIKRCISSTIYRDLFQSTLIENVVLLLRQYPFFIFIIKITAWTLKINSISYEKIFCHI